MNITSEQDQPDLDIAQRNYAMQRAFESWAALAAIHASNPSDETAHRREVLATTIGELVRPPIDHAAQSLIKIIDYCSSFDLADARQVALGGIFEAIPQYDPSKSLPFGFCYLISRRRMIDSLKLGSVLGANLDKQAVSLNIPVNDKDGEDLIDVLPSNERPFDDILAETEDEIQRREKIAEAAIALVRQSGLSLNEGVVTYALLQHLQDPDVSYTQLPLEIIGEELGKDSKFVDNTKRRAFMKMRGHHRADEYRELVA